MPLLRDLRDNLIEWKGAESSRQLHGSFDFAYDTYCLQFPYPEFANLQILLDTCTGRSLMYIKNNKGPRNDHCGTPDVTMRGLELRPLTVTNWERIVTNSLIQIKISESKSKGESFTIRWLWGTYQMLFATTRKIATVCMLVSELECMSWTIMASWVSQRNFFEIRVVRDEKNYYSPRNA